MYKGQRLPSGPCSPYELLVPINTPIRTHLWEAPCIAIWCFLPGSVLAQRPGPGVTPSDVEIGPAYQTLYKGGTNALAFKNSQERDRWLPRTS